MNIFKRIRNIWKIGELDSVHSTEILPKGDKVIKLIQKKKEMAKIIDLSADVDLND